MKGYERGVILVHVRVMQLEPERGTGVGIAKATEQQDCGTCIKLFGECVLNTINL